MNASTRLPLCALCALCGAAALSALAIDLRDHLPLAVGSLVGLVALTRLSPSSPRAALAGVLIAALATSTAAPLARCPLRAASLDPHARHEVALLATARSIPEPTPYGWRLDASLDQINHTALTDPPPITLTLPTSLFSTLPLPGARFATEAIVSSPVPRSPFAPLASEPVLYATATLPIEPLPTNALSIHVVLARWRLRMIESQRVLLPPRRAAYATAMTLGARGLLTFDQKEPFVLTGTSHLLAISGLHMGALAAFLWSLVRLLTRRLPRAIARRSLRRLADPAIGLSLILYTLIVGAPLSSRRALVMALSLLGARAMLRRVHPLRALCLTLLGIVCYAPELSRDPSLWLSASATGGILIGLDHARTCGWIDPRHGRLRRAVISSLIVSGCAFAATCPFVLALNAEIPLIGLLLNMIYVPLVSLLVFPTLCAGAALAPWQPELASALLHAGTWAIEQLGDTAHVAARLPGATWRPGLSWQPMLWPLTASIGLALWWLPHWRRACWATCCALAILTSPDLWRALDARWAIRAPRVEIHTIDVGQGESILVRLPDGYTLLIDAGGRHRGADPGRARVLPYLRRRGIRRVDAAWITHPDIDHMRGMFAVADLATPRMWLRAPEHQTDELDALTSLMRDRGAAIVPMTSRTLALLRAGAEVTLMMPQPLDSNSKNDLSLVTLVRHGPASILLPGDIERASESWLVEQRLGPVSLLHLPHHGSNTSTSNDLLDALRPRHAIASVGRHNRFGHPAEPVTARLRARHVPLSRTDRHGSIVTILERKGDILIKTSRSDRPRSYFDR